MALVRLPDGSTVEASDAQALDYYRGLGASIVDDGQPVALPSTVDQLQTEDVPEPPVKAAKKAEWVEFARKVDPALTAEAADDMTIPELIETYAPHLAQDD
ncbi:hypothetical protein [uncultured Jatrophihabitans sp.]|uniref:hypothetical protein n=1 Tax=uncultured Jatrophihabitans sp. TaxID=1610747 RepID=UPI0035C9E465